MSSPYIPNTNADRKEMLKVIGISSIDELFQDIPEKYRDVTFNLPPRLSEQELKDEISKMSEKNSSPNDYPCFLGAGHYQHFIPSVIDHIIGRSEFYTAYTPYQAEASQGTLQSIYEYQSLVCQLTGMEVSNAGMYDGSTAAAEAALMACRITKRGKVAVLSTINPKYGEVIKTYLSGQNISIQNLLPDLNGLPPDSACVIVQQPNFLGYFEGMVNYAKQVHDTGALLVIIANPISLGMFKSPQDYGADIAVAEGQPLGSPVNFGGPGLGIFACRQEYLRQMPGRIVGKTEDVNGNLGYVLTVATREQHIRRERATSNICTNEALVALATTVYLAIMGKRGLRYIAELCYHKAHYAAREIDKLKGFSLAFHQPFFNEFVIRSKKIPSKVNDALSEQGIIGGLDVSEIVEMGMLLCITELNTKQQIDKLVAVLRKL